MNHHWVAILFGTALGIVIAVAFVKVVERFVK